MQKRALLLTLFILALLSLLIVIFIIANNNKLDDASVSDTKEDSLTFCTQDAKVCSDGTSVGRDPNNNCEFPACPEEAGGAEDVVCAADVFECTDGSFVSRDPSKNCEFFTCPENSQENVDAGNSSQSTEPTPAPEGTVCTLDAMVCPDGSSVGRNPDNNCEFDQCPTFKNDGTSPEY